MGVKLVFNTIYKQPCTHIILHVCECIHRIDLLKSLLKDICIHHFGELFQNAPHKTCTNPALTICKSENFRSEIRYERWKHYVKLDCYPLGYSFIIPKESEAPQRKTVQTQLVWTFT